MQPSATPRAPVSRVVLPVLAALVALGLVLATPAVALALAGPGRVVSSPTSVAGPVTTSASPTTAAAADAGDDGDEGSADRIRLIITLLITFAAVMALVEILYWRRTRPIFPALEGLERLSTRRGRARARGEQLARKPGPDGPPPTEVGAVPHPDQDRVSAARGRRPAGRPGGGGPPVRRSGRPEPLRSDADG